LCHMGDALTKGLSAAHRRMSDTLRTSLKTNGVRLKGAFVEVGCHETHVWHTKIATCIWRDTPVAYNIHPKETGK